jgi:N-acetylneuraminic acid mutarotase
MVTVRSFHTATLLADGRVLIIGGLSGTTPLATAELYDPSEDRWAPAAAMGETHSGGHTATRLSDGQVLIVGGFGTRSQTEAERYDPTTDHWAAAGALADGRFGHTATLLADDRVLVTGGLNSARGGTYLATAELYDPAAGSWALAAGMASIRSGHTATRLPDGQVLVAGGRDASGPLPHAERYAPMGNRWAPAGALDEARWLHTATLLPSGRVLVVGGRDTSNGPVADAEQYEPATDSWTAAR